MGAYKDKNGKWYISVRYKNWLGEGCRKTKRGFSTKRDALEWEREFLARNTGSLDGRADSIGNPGAYEGGFDTPTLCPFQHGNQAKRGRKNGCFSLIFLALRASIAV